MSPIDFGRRRASPIWWWLTQRIWSIEHAFEHAKAQRKEDDTGYRIFFVLVLFATAFATLGGWAIARAVLSGDGGAGGAPEAAVARADLVDRNGSLLAIDLVHYGVYLEPDEVWDKGETRRLLAAALPQVPPARLDKALAGQRRTLLLSGLTPDEKQRIHDLGLPGVGFETEERRVYPLGPTGAHLIGYADTGGKGLAGAERALDAQIRHAGAAGQPVALAMDLRIQAVLQDELQKAVSEFQAVGGAGIVTDVHTGEILAMASAPDFDPNQAGNADPETTRDRMAASRFEMGSVMKVFTLALALDSGTATLDTVIDTTHPLQIGTRTIHDYEHAESNLTVAKVFTTSSNMGAARIGLMAGADTVKRYDTAFGLLSAAPVELAESARPILPGRWTDSAVASVSFGHQLALSPLAVTAGMGSILNGGHYVPLTILKRDANYVPPSRQVVSPHTASEMLRVMRMNVEHGTGTRADALGLRVGGKTGSAEKPLAGHIARKALISSFAAVFPTDGPLDAKRYFVLITLDEPKGDALDAQERGDAVDHPARRGGGGPAAGGEAEGLLGGVRLVHHDQDQVAGGVHRTVGGEDGGEG